MKTLFLIIILPLLLCGCLQLDPKVDQTQFYTLSQDAFPADDSGKIDWIDVQLMKFPDWAKSEPIVVLNENNKMSFSSFHRWGEPLKAGFLRVLGRGVQEESSQFVLRQWGRDLQLSEQVLVLYVYSMNAHSDGRVILEVVWGLKNKEDSWSKPPRRSVLSGSWTPDNFNSLAQTYTELSIQLGKKIGAELLE